eukprot:CAMPEP_0117042060 /NCGR_PEP_ID=MMETSP0472-20121206/29319_1 /TAXON_ID=693140 ORGANISM="Tiarina fusus, Strain LIS" /NCGR_SAMPLE_ID=MMETSP0472 /ASSEMBLY_ACC=CAM_ASM_000603 /LENGTH=216 /DNA_ID=CAMNT_0004753209 /DNA_START=1 /DNA_END=648 /DNA_ORIENTATION=-
MSEGRIVYSGIATASGIKVYHSDFTSINAVIQSLVTSIDFQIDQKRSFGAAPQTKGHTIQYLVDDEVAFISSATSEFPHRICFKFLQAISSEYKTHGDLSSTSGQRQISKFLAEKMKFYSEDSSVDQIRQLNSQVSEVKNIMHSNIESVLARGDSLDNIMTKAEALEDKSVIFHKRAKKLKCAMLQENIKMCVLLTAIIICIIIVLVGGLSGLIYW